MAPCIEGIGNVIIGLLPGFILLRVGRYDLLGPLRVIANDDSRVGQGNTALCPRVGAEAGAAYLVSIDEVGNFVPFGVHVRVACMGAYLRRLCLRTVGFLRGNWGWGGAAVRGRLGCGQAIHDS